TGEFHATDTQRVWSALGVLALGLPCSTVSRLFSSYFYSRHQARRLLWISLVRVLFSSGVGATLGLLLKYGLPGLCVGTTAGAFLELLLVSVFLKRAAGKLPALSLHLLIYACAMVPIGLIARFSSNNLPRMASGILAAGIFGGGVLLAAVLLQR